MQSPSLYCFPFSNDCRLMAEWGVIWQAIGVFAALLFGVIGLYKIYRELKRFNEQREKEIIDWKNSAELKRIEFFLSQHRRLFDNPELFSVLCLIDSDDEKLKHEDMWDKKRKFITFFEEIALLIRSNQLDREVAFYMFGYYAKCVRYGKNFAEGIDTSEEHWALFFNFAKDAEKFLDDHQDGPPARMSL